MTHTPYPVPFATRQPLLVRGGAALVVMGLARIAVAFGWIPPEWEVTESGVEQLFDGLVFAWAWFTSQQRVTPVADPKDNHGRPLVAGHVER